MDVPKSGQLSCTPGHGVLCRATWARGVEADWWEWSYDEERKEYHRADGSLLSPIELMAQAQAKQVEGWRLCLAVI